MADQAYRVAILARVSTPRQGEKPMSLPHQYAACQKYASERGWEVTEEIEDRASGMKWNRPGILRVIALAEQKQIDGVLALNHDRLCRDDDVRGWVKVELRQHGARVHYTEGPDELDSPESRLSDGVLGSAARYLRDKAVVGLTQGRVARVLDGKILHNGTPPYGYAFNSDQTGYVEDPVEAPWIVNIFERYANGWSPNQIAAWLNNEPGAPRPRRAEGWGRSAINGILNRDDYTGTGTRLGWEIPTDEHGRPLSKRAKKTGEGAVEMAFPRLISRELWQRSRAMRKEASHHTSYGKTDPDAALFKGTGRVICTGCGLPMAYESQAHAKNRKVKGLYRCRHSGCTSRASFRRVDIDELARCTIHDIVMDDEWLEARYEASAEAGGELDQEVDKATVAVKELGKQRKGLQNKVTGAVNNDLLYEPLAEVLQTVQAQWQAAREREADLLRQRARTIQDAERLRDFGKWLEAHRAGFDSLDIPGLRHLASLIDLRVRVARTPRGMVAKVTGEVRYDLSDSPFPGLDALTCGEPNERALERVEFDESSRNRSSRCGHR